MSTEDVFEFEGDQVTEFLLAVPSIKVETDVAYPRGTHLNVKGEFRVRSVRIEEDRKGNLTRHHVLVAETFSVTSFQTPEQRRALYEAEEAEIAAAAEQSVIQEQPGVEDAEGWDGLSDEEKAEARRVALASDDEVITVDGEALVVGDLVQEQFVDATATQEGVGLVEDADTYESVEVNF